MTTHITMNTEFLRPFGNTGLTVSPLGFGGGHVGSPEQDEKDVERLLHRVLDAGINLLDTARGYGLSEERIGRYLKSRRDEYVLSTKIGYSIPGYEDWTPEIIEAGIDTALKNLQTEVIDIVHLHSCPQEVLERGDVVTALQRGVEAGKVRVAAYSGDNEALAYAVSCGAFGSVQCSFSLCDQHILNEVLATARENGLGVIAKRPLANAPWRHQERPVGQYVETYWGRFREMGMDRFDLDWGDAALRFTVFEPGVHAGIVGTANPDHLAENIAIANRGALEEEVRGKIRDAFLPHAGRWTSEV